MRIPHRIERLCWRIACCSALAGLFVGCRDHAGGKSPGPVAEVTPREVLQAMVDAYGAADGYSDVGVLCLRYEQHGTRFHDEAPLAVATDGANRLRMHAYQAVVVCNGEELMAHVVSPQEEELGRQVLLIPAPAELSLANLLADPILQAAVTGGAGRLPIQLELLFGDEPLAAILPEAVRKRFLRPSRVEGRACHGIEVVTDEGRFVFWIDQESYVLRRLEYPADVVPEELGAEKPSLVAEFRQAKFATTTADATFLVSLDPNDQPVSAFVVPPAPLSSPLLGQKVTGFHFLNPAGADVTADSLQGQVAVMLWFSDHPASMSALSQLDRVRDVVDPQRVRMLAVCVESSARSHNDLMSLMRQWRVRVPLVRDLRAFGRDLFAVPGAPTLVVLDATGTVQIFEVGVNPKLVDELPRRLARIERGDDLAAEQRAQYAAEKAAFRAALQ